MEQTIFCENLKKFRLTKKYTQEQVANNLNVNVQTVSRLFLFWQGSME